MDTEENIEKLHAWFPQYSLDALTAVLRHHNSKDLERIIFDISEGFNAQAWLDVDNGGGGEEEGGFGGFSIELEDDEEQPYPSQRQRQQQQRFIRFENEDGQEEDCPDDSWSVGRNERGGDSGAEDDLTSGLSL